jgi:hypothetical protein
MFPTPKSEAQPTILNALEGAIKSIRNAAAEERSALSALNDSDRNLLREVEKRKQFVRAQQLDTIACWLLSETWHYAAWSSRDDAAKWLILPASEISAVDDRTTGRKTVHFTSNGMPLQLDFRPSRGGSAGQGDLRIASKEGETLLALAVSEFEYDRWCAFSVELFKPGTWVAVLVALYEQAQVEQEIRRVLDTSGPEKLASLKKAFDL